MVGSPIKKRLAQNAGKLKALPKKQREILAGGSESVVLIDGHTQVLLVTRKIAAKNIELLHGIGLEGQPFVKPKIVAIDADLARLINPKDPELGKRIANINSAVFYRELWQQNVVYSLPRYDGTLVDLNKIRFKDKNIEALEEMLTGALTFLHQQQLTHNDLVLKNIFYKGECPHLQFYLGDFGSLSKNTEKNHAGKCAKDFSQMKRVIDSLKKILANREKKRANLSQGSTLLPCFTAQLIKKMGASPLKPIVPVCILQANENEKKRQQKPSAKRSLRF